MTIDGLLHVNIRCSETDLPAIERFYGDALAMKAGPRPAFNFPGIWLYYGDEPLIHVSARFPAGSIARQQNHSGSIDHVAFKCTGPAELRARLLRNGIAFQQQNVENAGFQIFLIDPVGTRLEFNFPNSQALDMTAPGGESLQGS